MAAPELSFVSPVYGCREALAELFERIERVAASLGKSFEVILVDDRCPQNSWDEITRLASIHPEIIGVRLSRNFGQHSAIEAGLRYSRGEWTVVLDCDLQDRPEDVPALLSKAAEGFQVVRARRSLRRDHWIRRVLSRAFYYILEELTDTKQDPATANFGVYHRKVVEAISSWHEQTRFFPAIVQWVGFDSTVVDVTHSERHSGQSTYNLRKLIGLATTVALSFSEKPLRIAVYFGLFIVSCSIVVSSIVFLKAILGTFTVAGFASIMLSIWFLGGSIITVVGISGLYIGKALMESKRRPTYVVDEVVGKKPLGVASDV